jgi:RimJ/RimL family protein N-acetyltransferase
MATAELLSSKTPPEFFSVTEPTTESAILTARQDVILLPVTESADIGWSLAHRKNDFPVPPNHPEAPDYIAFKANRLKRAYDISDRRDYGIWGEDGATLVGLITLYPWGQDLVDIGYDVAPKYRRQGYASLALRAIANHARDIRQLKTQATIAVGNVASQATALKAGFEVADILGGVIIYTDQAGL